MDARLSIMMIVLVALGLLIAFTAVVRSRSRSEDDAMDRPVRHGSTPWVIAAVLGVAALMVLRFYRSVGAQTAGAGRVGLFASDNLVVMIIFGLVAAGAMAFALWGRRTLHREWTGGSRRGSASDEEWIEDDRPEFHSPEFPVQRAPARAGVGGVLLAVVVGFAALAVISNFAVPQVVNQNQLSAGVRSAASPTWLLLFVFVVGGGGLAFWLGRRSTGSSGSYRADSSVPSSPGNGGKWWLVLASVVIAGVLFTTLVGRVQYERSEAERASLRAKIVEDHQIARQRLQGSSKRSSSAESGGALDSLRLLDGRTRQSNTAADVDLANEAARVEAPSQSLDAQSLDAQSLDAQSLDAQSPEKLFAAIAEPWVWTLTGRNRKGAKSKNFKDAEQWIADGEHFEFKSENNTRPPNWHRPDSAMSEARYGEIGFLSMRAHGSRRSLVIGFSERNPDRELAIANAIALAKKKLALRALQTYLVRWRRNSTLEDAHRIAPVALDVVEHGEFAQIRGAYVELANPTYGKLYRAAVGVEAYGGLIDAICEGIRSRLEPSDREFVLITAIVGGLAVLLVFAAALVYALREATRAGAWKLPLRIVAGGLLGAIGFGVLSLVLLA